MLRYAVAALVMPTVAFAGLDSLTETDRRWSLQITGFALENQALDHRYVWENPYSNNRGEIVLRGTPPEPGFEHCTRFESFVLVQDTETYRDGFVACPEGGAWEIHQFAPTLQSYPSWTLVVNSPLPSEQCESWSITVPGEGLTTDGMICRTHDRLGRTMWYTGD